MTDQPLTPKQRAIMAEIQEEMTEWADRTVIGAVSHAAAVLQVAEMTEAFYEKLNAGLREKRIEHLRFLAETVPEIREQLVSWAGRDIWDVAFEAGLALQGDNEVVWDVKINARLGPPTDQVFLVTVSPPDHSQEDS